MRPGDLSTSEDRQLLLEVTIGPVQRTYLVQPGITIGRAPDNAICVDGVSMGWLHARVLRQDDGRLALACEDRWSLTLANGDDAPRLCLADGVEFRIDRARFRCAAARVMILPHDAPDAAILPHDAPDVATLPHDAADAARFCPRCGMRVGERVRARRERVASDAAKC